MLRRLFSPMSRTLPHMLTCAHTFCVIISGVCEARDGTGGLRLRVSPLVDVSLLLSDFSMPYSKPGSLYLITSWPLFVAYSPSRSHTAFNSEHSGSPFS